MDNQLPGLNRFESDHARELGVDAHVYNLCRRAMLPILRRLAKEESALDPHLAIVRNDNMAFEDDLVARLARGFDKFIVREGGKTRANIELIMSDAEIQAIVAKHRELAREAA